MFVWLVGDAAYWVVLWQQVGSIVYGICSGSFFTNGIVSNDAHCVVAIAGRDIRYDHREEVVFILVLVGIVVAGMIMIISTDKWG